MPAFKERLEEALSLRNISPAELSKLTGIGEGAISQYRKGAYKASQRNLEKIATALRVPIPWLMGISDDLTDYQIVSTIPVGFEPLPQTKNVPLVGMIACGEPILAEENLDGFVNAPINKSVDFALTCRGDSMVGAGIYDGDIAYIRQQSEVENGQIAAVRIGDEATLKRVYYYPEEEKIILQAANDRYAPLAYTGEELNNISIEGLLIGYTHWVEFAKK